MAPLVPVPPELVDAIEQVRLVDHHVHGALAWSPSRAAFGDALNEADTDPVPGDVDPFDSQLGFAIRAHCASVLGLPRHASADDYWTARSALPEPEVNRRFLQAAGVSDWIVDPGIGAGALLDPAAMAVSSQASSQHVVRLETMVENLARLGTPPAAVVEDLRGALHSLSSHVVGAKTILAYRCGFAVDLSRPSDDAVRTAYASWVGNLGDEHPRVTDPVLIAFGIHEALQLGLPLQIHVGLGDRDLTLADSDPLLLTGLLRTSEARRSAILLLHCYPFEREAGYLAQGFANVFLDVGLSVNYLGARATALVARTFELAPFHKILYSSDAAGPAELHYLGARLWRVALTRVLGRFVADDDWSLADAVRVARMVSRDNAFRAYPKLANGGS